MIKLNCFLIAEYAAISTDGKLTIAGTFDSLSLTRNPEAPADAAALVHFPHAYIAIVTEASLADGLTHEFRLRVLDGNGERVMDELPMQVNYALNAFGRPLRNNLIVSLNGLILPGPDDYVFEVTVQGYSSPLAEFIFSVAEVPGSANG